MEVTKNYQFRNALRITEKRNRGTAVNLRKVLQQLTWVLLIVGTGLRLFHFFYNRSLWTDEIYLASSLIRMNYLELTAPALDYQQKAPLGFLWLARTSVLLFGKSEMALRLVPLLAGVAALWLFAPVCRYFLKPIGVLLAVGIFALAPPLVYHSVEIKQYGFDLLIAVIALQLYIRYHKKKDWPSLLLWGFLGALLIWFSFPVVFVLAGIGTGVCIHSLVEKSYQDFLKYATAFSFWAFSFAVNFYFFTYKQTDSEWVAGFFRYYNGFMPFPPSSLADLKWFTHSIYLMFYNPLGLLWNSSYIGNPVVYRLLKLPIISFIFLVAGGVLFARQQWQHFIVLAVPFFLHLFVSAFEMYPFMDRFHVFSVPMLLLFIGKGGQWITSFAQPRYTPAYFLLLLVLAGPAFGSAMQLARPKFFGGSRQSTQREGLLHVKENYREGDVVYLYWNMMHSYIFYKSTYGLQYPILAGSDFRYKASNPKDYISKLLLDLAPTMGKKRVWIVYNRFLSFDIGDDIYTLPLWYQYEVKGGNKFRWELQQIGKELAIFQTFDTNVLLFDFSQAKPQSTNQIKSDKPENKERNVQL